MKNDLSERHPGALIDTKKQRILKTNQNLRKHLSGEVGDNPVLERYYLCLPLFFISFLYTYLLYVCISLLLSFGDE